MRALVLTFLKVRNSPTITSSSVSGIVTIVYLVSVDRLAAKVSSIEPRFCTRIQSNKCSLFYGRGDFRNPYYSC